MCLSGHTRQGPGHPPGSVPQDRSWLCVGEILCDTGDQTWANRVQGNFLSTVLSLWLDLCFGGASKQFLRTPGPPPGNTQPTRPIVHYWGPRMWCCHCPTVLGVHGPPRQCFRATGLHVGMVGDMVLGSKPGWVDVCPTPILYP